MESLGPWAKEHGVDQDALLTDPDVKKLFEQQITE